MVDVPPRQYLMADGHGDPNTGDDFATAVEALFSLAYAVKFASKKQLERDFAVMPLEALWWAEDMRAFSTSRDASQWDFTAMVLQPEWITPELFEKTRDAVRAKKPGIDVGRVRLETLTEGTCAQTLHVGSFADEGEILRIMHEQFIPEHGYALTGKHHEIYFSDVRKTAPEKLRTLLRQPVALA
jgi:hypothetical protein